MAVDFATLGLRIENGEVVRGIKSLYDLVDAGQKAEVQTNRLASSFTKMRQASYAREAQQMADQLARLDPFQQSAGNSGNRLAATHRVAADATDHHRLAIGKINQALEGLAVETVGVNGKLGSIGAKFAEFGIGGIWTGAILAGLAAIAFAWEKITEKSREAGKAQKEALDRLADLQKKQAGGIYGGVQFDRAEAYKVYLENEKAIAAKRKFLEVSGVMARASNQKDLDDLIATRGTLLGIIEAANREMLRVDHERAEDQARLREAATADALAQSAALMTAHDAEIKALSQIADAYFATASARRIDQEAAAAGLGTREQLRVHLEHEAAVMEAYVSSSGPAEQRIRLQIADATYRQAQATAYLADQRALADFGKGAVAAGVRRLGSEVPDLIHRSLTATDMAAIDAEKQRAEATKQINENLLRELQGDWSTFFQEIGTRGLRSIGDLVGGIKSTFLKMFSDLLAADVMKRVAGMLGGGGSQTGGMLSSLGLGTGVAGLGPWGMAAAGIITAGSLLIGASKASAEASRQQQEAAKAVTAAAKLYTEKGLGASAADLSWAKRQAGFATGLGGGALGFDPSTLSGSLASQFVQLARDFREQIDAAEKYHTATGGISASFIAQANALVEAQKKLDQAAADSAKNDAIGKLKDQIRSIGDALGTLSGFRNSLLLSDASTLSPTQKLAEAKRQYDLIKAQALGGDPNAIGQYTQAAQAYLAASRGVYASGYGYAQTFQQVMSDSSALQTIFEAQRSIAQNQLAAIEHGNDIAREGLGSLIDEVKKLRQDMNGWRERVLSGSSVESFS